MSTARIGDVNPVALAYPMHGQYKLSNEGYRTRDGHIIEWLGQTATLQGNSVTVISRPEPAILAPSRRIRGSVAGGTKPVETRTWRLPSTDPKHWWVKSAKSYPRVDGFGNLPAVVWNPFASTAPSDRSPYGQNRTTVFDLLDDWTIHQDFASIRGEVEDAYRRSFDASSVVFANGEGTLELAHRFGRTDAVLMPNGVDPERFAVPSRASGPLTVGYAGKIGSRLDAELIADVCDALPDVRFVFAGPFLDPTNTYRKLLTRLPNVDIVGDIQYERLPELIATFDLGWVPHAVGKGEVGGDVIKIYEYRAAGLQVLTTPISGAGRSLTNGVHIIAAKDQASWLRSIVQGRLRLDRVPECIGEELTWKYKAEIIADALGLKKVS